ncbi:ABC transporter substrate-binding protein [Acidobacteriota bacterium]
MDNRMLNRFSNLEIRISKLVIRSSRAGIFLLILITPALLFCAQNDRPAIKIGVMGPLTGPASAYGISQLNGVKLAVDEINKYEALPNNARIELVVADDQAEMARVGNLLIPMIYEDRILALIGCINSACTHVAQMVTVKAHVPMITTTSTDPSLTLSGSPYTFRCLADDLSQGRAIAEFVFKTKGYSRVALINQDNRYGRMGAKTIEEIAKELKRDVPVRATFAGKQKDFTEIVARIKKEKPDAIVIWGLYNGSALLTKALRSADITTPILGSDGLVSPMYIEMAGKAAEGIVVTYPFDADRNDPMTKRFVMAYTKQYGKPPDSFAAHSYDAMYILVRALQRSMAVDREKLKDAMLETKNFPGVTGPITFDENGNDTRDVILARIENGAFKPLRNEQSDKK